MEIYQTNAALGYMQLAYIIKLNQTKNGYDYLVIGGKNITSDDYEIGTVIKDLEDIYIEETDYKIENSPLFGKFLFEYFLKNKDAFNLLTEVLSYINGNQMSLPIEQIENWIDKYNK